MNNLIIVLCTCPNQVVAKKLAKTMVEVKLAACVNLIPGINSIFMWQEKIGDEAEELLIIKTTNNKFEALKSWLKENHPYDVPEIIGIPIEYSSQIYLKWVNDTVNI